MSFICQFFGQNCTKTKFNRSGSWHQDCGLFKHIGFSKCFNPTSNVLVLLQDWWNKKVGNSSDFFRGFDNNTYYLLISLNNNSILCLFYVSDVILFVFFYFLFFILYRDLLFFVCCHILLIIYYHLLPLLLLLLLLYLIICSFNIKNLFVFVIFGLFFFQNWIFFFGMKLIIFLLIALAFTGICNCGSPFSINKFDIRINVRIFYFCFVGKFEWSIRLHCTCSKLNYLIMFSFGNLIENLEILCKFFMNKTWNSFLHQINCSNIK